MKNPKILCKYVPGKWIQGDLENSNAVPFPRPDFSILQGLSNVEVFEQFFTSDIFEFLKQQVQLYSQFKNCPDANISKENIQCFIAILILSAYNEVPGKRCY